MRLAEPVLKLATLFGELMTNVGALVIPLVAFSETISMIEDRLNKFVNPNYKAIEDNTKAVQRLNTTIRETSGGGARAQGALPRNLRGNFIDQNVVNALGSGVPI